MVEGAPIGPLPPPDQFTIWYRQPENEIEVWRAWTRQWEQEHWAKDEPKELFTPEEQTRVDEYYRKVINTLEARTGVFSNVVDEEIRKRAVDNWEGENAFMRLYDGTANKDRAAIIQTLGIVIEDAEKHPEISAQVIDFVTVRDLSEIESSIKRLSRTQFAKENELLQKSIDTYKTSRILKTFTPERSKAIYQELTAI